MCKTRYSRFNFENRI